MASLLRQHILTAATELFAKNGFRATGVDAIIARAGVAKKTLYTHFRGKDVLIATVLRGRLEQWLEWMKDELGERATDPRSRVLALFEAYFDAAEEGRFKGDLFTAAAVEFPSAEASVRGVIREEAALTYSLLRDLCAKAGAPNPDTLATDLALLRRGAVAAFATSGDAGVFRQARDAADRVLESHGVTRAGVGMRLPG
jgi:AcrR family transcriptional regulator